MIFDRTPRGAGGRGWRPSIQFILLHKTFERIMISRRSPLWFWIGSHADYGHLVWRPVNSFHNFRTLNLPPLVGGGWGEGE